MEEIGQKARVEAVLGGKSVKYLGEFLRLLKAVLVSIGEGTLK
jgi:hypothetical protein